MDVEYPSGHPARRRESTLVFQGKFNDALARHFAADRVERIMTLCQDQDRFEAMSVEQFIDELVVG